MEGAQPEPGLEEENGQPEEQASQKRSGEGWVVLGHHLLYIMHLCLLTLSHTLFLLSSGVSFVPPGGATNGVVKCDDKTSPRARKAKAS